MPDGYIKLKTEVFTRDEFGRFAEHCLSAARKTANDAAEEGARVARALAPKKTSMMAGTIHASSATGAGISMMAQFSVGTNHWRFQERGTASHGIPGNVSFYWERERRRWVPGDNTIHHPGNPGIHFMEAGYRAAETKLVEGMRRNYELNASF